MIFYPDNPEGNKPPIDGEKVEQYPNLRAAGQQLALRLDTFRHSPDVVVVGIARGAAGTRRTFVASRPGATSKLPT